MHNNTNTFYAVSVLYSIRSKVYTDVSILMLYNLNNRVFSPF